MKQLFEEIQKQSEFIFFYKDSQLDVDKTITIDFENAPVQQIMEQVLADSNLWFKVIDRQIVIFQIKKEAIPEKKTEPTNIEQPQKKSLKGKVTDAKGLPIPGTTVIVKGTSVGTITDGEGNFSLGVPTDAKTLVFSFIGMKPQEYSIIGKTIFEVSLQEETVGVEEVVVVGYGKQKKETLVGAITQTKREELERSGGVSNLAEAMTGRLPGVTTIVTTDQPGANDPQIFIRGQSSWNNSSPLILVDGIERRMNDIDFSEVESVSVLKDASATAVFGVKGAEGVILINTRRGQKGQAQLSVSANQGIAFLARMPKKLDAYDTYMFQNLGIENELPVRETGWAYYQPMEMVKRFKKPQAPGDQYIYPNVDWTDAMTRDFASSSRVNLNVTGGTDFAKYFGSFAYTHDGDLLNSGLKTETDYIPNYSYDRFNYRTNLDFNLTSSTSFSVNLAGYLGMKKDTRAYSENDLWRAFYNTPPAAFPIRHEDGTWSYTPLESLINPIRLLNSSGINKTYRTQVTTDFVLKQKLDFLLKGLSMQGSLSYDNEMYSSSGVGVTSVLSKYISPTGVVSYDPVKGQEEFDFVFRPSYKDPETVSSGNLSSSYRRLFYQLQMNYERKFDIHSLAVTALMNREEYAIGSMFPRYREDWVGRVTYNYESKYLFESNAAYNGSEKFGKGYRFGFFPSVAVGWVVTNEKFMKQYNWLNKLKIKYSIGKIGSDNFSSERWSYDTNWGIDGGGNTMFGYPTAVSSPYTQYKENVVGNPDLQWEVAQKQNLGFEIGLWDNLFQVNLDLFNENRDKIFISSGSRNVPAYFGAKPVSANIGKTESKGYEFDLQFRKTTSQKFTYYADYNIAYSKNRVIYKEDPEALPWYMKAEGFQMGQTKTNIVTNFINDWDMAYATVKNESNLSFRLPGDVALLDYNGDGVINNYDAAPFGFVSRPQYTYNFSLGGDYKGFSVMVQFYGVFNSTRSQSTSAVKGLLPVNWDFIATDYWTPDNIDARWPAPRVESSTSTGNINYLDGSILRLKTAEIAYTIETSWLKRFNMKSLKIYVNGNNLFFWSDLPEDRESSYSGYPTLRRINVGFTANF